MELLASFQRKFDALECTLDITYSIRSNKKIWARIKCRQKWIPKTFISRKIYLKSGSYKRHFHRSKKYINTLL